MAYDLLAGGLKAVSNNWKNDLPPNRATTCAEANQQNRAEQSIGGQQEQTGQVVGGQSDQNWAGDPQYAPWNQPQHVCPACGYCPCCGRRNNDYGHVPYYPPYQPYYPPVGPVWMSGIGQVTSDPNMKVQSWYTGLENKIY